MKETEEEKRVQEKGAVEEVQRFHQKDYRKSRRGKGKKEGRKEK